MNPTVIKLGFFILGSLMSNTIIAAYWMIGTMLFLSMMAISGRELGGDLDTFEIMTYRSLIGIMIVLFFIIYNKSYFEINIKKLKLHFIRNIFHFTGQNLWFFAVIYIPLSQLFAFVIYSTYLGCGFGAYLIKGKINIC